MHSFSIVILPANVISIREFIKQILAPFYMELEVEPYKEFFTKEYTYDVARQRGAGTNLELIDEILREKEKDMGVENGLIYWMTTYNPNSKWDYWKIGGNYDKAIYELKTSLNLKQIGNDEDICNNTCPVSLIPKDCIPYSIVTPNGDWYSEADYGWKMMNSKEENEKALIEWKKKVKYLFEKYWDSLAVGLDVHS